VTTCFFFRFWRCFGRPRSWESEEEAPLLSTQALVRSDGAVVAFSCASYNAETFSMRAAKSSCETAGAVLTCGGMTRGPGEGGGETCCSC